MRPSTVRGYEAAAREILPHLGDTLLIALTLDHLKRMVADIQRDATKPLARRAGESIKTILSWGDEDGWESRAEAPSPAR